MNKTKPVAAPHTEIAWLEGDGKGYTDVFATGEFSKDVEGAVRPHRVRGPRGGEHEARFRLTTSGLWARLDYNADKTFNKRRGMTLGVLELRFQIVRELLSANFIGTKNYNPARWLGSKPNKEWNR